MGRNTSDGSVRSSRRGSTRAVAAGGVTAAVVIGGLFGTAGMSNAASGWDAVGRCESGGNASINTGNGYFGLYQFDAQTWQGLGYSGTANQYSASVQTQAAERLYAERGSSPWPHCGRYLSGSAAVSLSSTHVSRGYTRRPMTASSSAASSRYATASTSRFTGPYPASAGLLGAWLVSEHRADVQAVQARLADKGYRLAVDGQYGLQTSGVVLRFQRNAGITADGVYGAQTKAALFG